MKTTLHILMFGLLIIYSYFVYAFIAGYYQSVVTLIGSTIGSILLLGALANYYVQRCGNTGILGRVDQLYRSIGLIFKTGK